MNLSKETLNKFRYAIATQVGDLDPYHKSIGFDDLPGEFAASEFTILFSGPPTVAMAKKNEKLLYPIGLVQDLSYNGQRNITPIPELGNKSYRYVPGRIIHAANIGRLLARESGSILYACYAWLDRLLKDKGGAQVFANLPPQDNEVSGHGRHWLTLDSDVFNIPTGFLLVVGNQDGEILGKVYWEKCVLPDHMLRVSAGETTISEQISLKMARAVPCGINVDLLGGNPFRT